MSDWRAREGLGPEASSPLNLGPSPPGFTVSAAGSGSVSPGLHLERVHGGCDFWPCFQDRPGQPGGGAGSCPELTSAARPPTGGPEPAVGLNSPACLGCFPEKWPRPRQRRSGVKAESLGLQLKNPCHRPGGGRGAALPLSAGLRAPLGHRAWHPRHLLARSVSPSSRRPRAGTLGAELRARGRRGRCR